MCFGEFPRSAKEHEKVLSRRSFALAVGVSGRAAPHRTAPQPTIVQRCKCLRLWSAAPPSWTLRAARLSLFFWMRKQGLSTFIHSLHTHFPYPLMLVPADSYDKPLSRAG